MKKKGDDHPPVLWRSGEKDFLTKKFKNNGKKKKDAWCEKSPSLLRKRGIRGDSSEEGKRLEGKSKGRHFCLIMRGRHAPQRRRKKRGRFGIRVGCEKACRWPPSGEGSNERLQKEKKKLIYAAGREGNATEKEGKRRKEREFLYFPRKEGSSVRHGEGGKSVRFSLETSGGRVGKGKL